MMFRILLAFCLFSTAASVTLVICQQYCSSVQGAASYDNCAPWNSYALATNQTCYNLCVHNCAAVYDGSCMTGNGFRCCLKTTPTKTQEFVTSGCNKLYNNLPGMSYIPNGTILNERFVIERQLGAWYGERCYHGRDSQNNKQIVLKAFLPADPRIQAYVDFFKECSGMQGIPTFLAHFSSYESEFIAHEYNGVLLRGILNARMFHISLENTIRLGYRLFKILHAIHLKGYELVVNLTYFGHAALIDEPPSNNKIILGPYQSLHVSRGGAYSRIDDYISVVLVMLSCQTINPFDFNINRDLTHVQKKDNFHANPYAVLTPQTMWLGDLYLQLEEMRADRLSHLQVMAALRRAVPGFDPQTAITYRNDVESVYHLID
ncbi:hypothetical protein L5515_017355 [Caenorhabditis briggsae]|uniref:Protein kinase domain-containing protein n=5 Tax=Caenorhabditis TaxID=6237 RepID=A0AAE9F8C2_CAEBR|nr:hypothetical protein L5515_017355 [Caenorhabditis briggsae]